MDKLDDVIKEMQWWMRIKPDLPSVCGSAIEVMEEAKERIAVLEEEAKTKSTPQKVLNRKELADLIVGECPLCGALFNNEICPTSCGWCGCLLDWKDGEQE